MRAPAPPRVTVLPDARSVGESVAEQVVSALRGNPRVVLGLPTGRTPIPTYEALVSRFSDGRADFSLTTTFNLDEFLGLTADHPSSFRAFMNRHFFDLVNVAPSRINFLSGNPVDADAECRRYERAIADAGGIDVQLLGLGTNGHIGFNEPGAVLEARTHRVRLMPETRAANAALFNGDERVVPAEALSMGMATILQAREIVLLATGAAKARCVAAALRGPITPALPASFLQLHPHVDVMLDAAAAEAWARP
jgi:glucosamine-6-phosphate deaminase